MKDWRGNDIPAKRAADLEPGDKGAGLWGRVGTVAETIERDDHIYVRWTHDPPARWKGDTAGLTAYQPDSEIPERDPLDGYRAAYGGILAD